MLLTWRVLINIPSQERRGVGRHHFAIATVDDQRRPGMEPLEMDLAELRRRETGFGAITDQ